MSEMHNMEKLQSSRSRSCSIRNPVEVVHPEIASKNLAKKEKHERDARYVMEYKPFKSPF